MIKEALSNIPFTRRQFLLGSGVVLFSKVFIEPFFPKKASAYPLYDFDLLNPEISQLEKYLKKIEPERKRLEIVVAQNDLFGDFKELTPSQRLEDFNTYYAMWLAGEIKFGIPWRLTCTFHVHETTASRDPEPDGKYHRGAMGRRYEYFPDEEVKMAAEGWEFLHDLPQRYCPKNGWPHYDSDEILWAASDLKRRALIQQKNNPTVDFETNLLEGAKTYCAPEYGEQRVARYKIIKEIFAKNNL